jgi:uncharacterized membrane protein
MMPVAKSMAQRQSAAVSSQWIPAAKQSGQFVKHVVPAAVKPLHALWHQVLGFVFLVFAVISGWKVWSSRDTAAPVMLVIAIFFVIVMAAYGISSIRKANRISKS